MNEVLIALGRSASDPDAVLDSIVESVRRLCRCEAAAIMLIEGDEFVLASSVGFSDEYVSYVSEHPFKLDRASMLGRVTQDRDIQQIPDVLADPEYGRQDVQRIVRFRTMMAAPMLLDDEVVGVLSLVRTEVDPFDDRSNRAARRLRRPGGDRGPQRAPRREPRGTRSRAGSKGRAARGAERGRRGGQLQPRPRRGAVHASS